MSCVRETHGQSHVQRYDLMYLFGDTLGDMRLFKQASCSPRFLTVRLVCSHTHMHRQPFSKWNLQMFDLKLSIHLLSTIDTQLYCIIRNILSVLFSFYLPLLSLSPVLSCSQPHFFFTPSLYKTYNVTVKLWYTLSLQKAEFNCYRSVYMNVGNSLVCWMRGQLELWVTRDITPTLCVCVLDQTTGRSRLSFVELFKALSLRWICWRQTGSRQWNNMKPSLISSISILSPCCCSLKANALPTNRRGFTRPQPAHLTLKQKQEWC